MTRTPHLPLAAAPLALLLACSATVTARFEPAGEGEGEGGTGGGDGTGDGDGAGDVDAAADLPPFSFFVTSLTALTDLSGNPLGFGGDLRFGETGPGAGLRGADKICAAIAERSMPGAGGKPWRAFLSAAADETGAQVDAIDRIGEGPWFDRLGRMVAAGKADLVSIRPVGADPAIADDLPNEDGVPNHQPDPAQPEVDNHHMLTGSGPDGRLLAAGATCLDWTGGTGAPAEGRPHCGLAWPRGVGGGASASHWISALDEAGCAPGINLEQTGGPDFEQNNVGSGGGYGGFYCFSLAP